MYGASTSWGRFPLGIGIIHSFSVGYVSKWIEAITTLKNNSHTMVKFLKKHFLT